MGYRIELGEIEAAAGSIEKVKSAAALYDADAGRILVIYEGSIKDTDEVLQQTADKVPPDMRPDEAILHQTNAVQRQRQDSRSSAAAERILRCIAGSLRRGLSAERLATRTASIYATREKESKQWKNYYRF